MFWKNARIQVKLVNDRLFYACVTGINFSHCTMVHYEIQLLVVALISKVFGSRAFSFSIPIENL